MKHFIYFFVLIVLNCTTKSEVKEFSVYSFFENTDWREFNKKSLIRNNLSYIIDNNIDLFERESFFKFMSTYNKKQFYDILYIIEIFTNDGENSTNKKILLIKYRGETTFIGFKKGISWNIYQVTEKEKMIFNLFNSKVKKINSEQKYVLISEVRGMAF